MIIFKTKTFKVERFRVNKHGKKFEFERIIPDDSAVILPIMPDGRILLERQYRPVVGRYLYEIPAGHLNKGERSTSAAAARELEEETGYVPGSLKKIMEGYVAPGSSTEKQTYFIARKLRKTKQNLDPEEIIETRAVTLKRAMQMIKSHQIKDDKTVAAILYYATFMGR